MSSGPPGAPPPREPAWGRLYALVIVELAAMILLCAWITSLAP